MCADDQATLLEEWPDDGAKIGLLCSIDIGEQRCKPTQGRVPEAVVGAQRQGVGGTGEQQCGADGQCWWGCGWRRCTMRRKAGRLR
jgi:hypothetical protein